MTKLRMTEQAYEDLGFVKVGKEFISPDDFSEMEELTVKGTLDLRNNDYLKKLPNKLTVHGDLYLAYNLELTSLPDTLIVGKSLDIVGCFKLASLGNNLTVKESISIAGCPADKFPQRLVVGGDILLAHTRLPDNLPAGAKVKGEVYFMADQIGGQIRFIKKS